MVSATTNVSSSENTTNGVNAVVSLGMGTAGSRVSDGAAIKRSLPSAPTMRASVT